MATIFNPNYLDQAQQVQKNKDDIARLQKYIKQPYHSTVKLTEGSTTVSQSDTNIPEGVTEGFLIDTASNLFEIVTVNEGTVYINFWTNFKGEEGVGILTIENTGYSDGDDFTVTHCKATLSDGREESFDVQAKHGRQGPKGDTAEAITIDSPSSATSGTLSGDQLTTLQANDQNYIIFDNELYSLQDKQHDSGFLIYAHVGQDNSNTLWIKEITITISSKGWVLTKFKPASEENWTVLYDKDDENLNYGYTEGIMGNAGIINEFPDLVNYQNKMRIYFIKGSVNSTEIFDFDISAIGGKNHTMVMGSVDGLALIFATIIVNTVDDKRIFEANIYRRIDFILNKYPTLTNLKDNKDYYITKILIC